jgi:hypothetical protein
VNTPLAFASRREALADCARRRYGIHSRRRQNLKAVPLVTHRADLGFWISLAYTDNREDIRILVTLALLGALYGGVHCLPWNDKFPTSVERKLWRIAAIILTSAASCWGVTEMTIDEIKLQPAWLDNIVSSGFGIFGLVLVPLSYCIANLYILVESFRQLLYLPPQAYQLPVWSNYWPHFG